MKTTIIKELLGVSNDNYVYCVDGKNGKNSFKVVVFQTISKRELRYLNSSNYIKEFLNDSLTNEEIKEQFGSISNAVKMIKTQTYYSDLFYPFQDNSSIDEYQNALDEISKKSIFGFIPATFSCVGFWHIKKVEIENFKYIHNQNLYKEIIENLE